MFVKFIGRFKIPKIFQKGIEGDSAEEINDNRIKFILMYERWWGAPLPKKQEDFSFPKWQGQVFNHQKGIITYHETEEEHAWACEIDRYYLSYLAKHNFQRFLLEMTPQAKHNGACVGLNLEHPHHQLLQKEFYPEVERICREQGLTHHPALGELLEPETAHTPIATTPKQESMLQKAKEIMEKTTPTPTKCEANTTTDEKPDSTPKIPQPKRTRSKQPNSSWLRIWGGKYLTAGSDTEYQAVAKKETGSTPGFVVQSMAGKRYIARWALDNLEDEKFAAQRHNLQRSVGSIIAEKLALDVYGALGYGFFYVPKHRLASLEIVNDFTKENEIVQASLKKMHEGGSEKTTKGICLLSRWMDALQPAHTLEKCMVSAYAEPKPFIDCLKIGHIPEQALIEGKMVPILGLVELLAVSRLLADVDVVGKNSRNVGYIIERENNQPTAVRLVKINAGSSFYFAGANNQLTQAFNPFASGYALSDAKDLQLGAQRMEVIKWRHLTPGQHYSFFATLQRGLAFLRNDAVLDFLIHRKGLFAEKLTEHCILLQEKTMSTFKAMWKQYQDIQTMPQVYGNILGVAKPVIPPSVPFTPKFHGAPTHQTEEAEWLALMPEPGP